MTISGLISNTVVRYIFILPAEELLDPVQSRAIYQSKASTSLFHGKGGSQTQYPMW